MNEPSNGAVAGANRSPILIGFGVCFLLYAVAGNYIALPGYIRFLERGGVSETGNSFDITVAIGAAKTILWMISFQLGILCLAAAHSRSHGLKTKWLTIGICVWLALWTWPALPAPGAWFYICFGGVVMAAIAGAIAAGPTGEPTQMRQTLLLGALVFFAFATWEVCGLGSTGRMLHPEQATSPMAHNILVTQSTKLMIEFLIAWALLLASFAPFDRRSGAAG